MSRCPCRLFASLLLSTPFVVLNAEQCSQGLERVYNPVDFLYADIRLFAHSWGGLRFSEKIREVHPRVRNCLVGFIEFLVEMNDRADVPLHCLLVKPVEQGLLAGHRYVFAVEFNSRLELAKMYGLASAPVKSTFLGRPLRLPQPRKRPRASLLGLVVFRRSLILATPHRTRLIAGLWKLPSSLARLSNHNKCCGIYMM